MERNEVLKELWSLRNLLNRGNKLANKKTELKFKIEKLVKSEFRVVLTISNTHEHHKIELARRGYKNWERSGLTHFKKLELFCANFLNEQEKINQQNIDYQNFTLDELLHAIIDNLQKTLNDLMINY